MKKIISILILCIFFLVVVLDKNHSSSNLHYHRSININVIPTPAIPIRIVIPSLHILANIERVGLDKKQRMDIPTHAMDVGWYYLGTRPGAIGSAVIDGHYDTVTGSPAVFYKLTQLRIQDTINITDANNKTYIYTVTKIATYPYNSLPLLDIFGRNNNAYLNLITCEGLWDKNTKNYSERTVIYAQKVR